jgi:hypothetical protein
MRSGERDSDGNAAYGENRIGGAYLRTEIMRAFLFWQGIGIRVGVRTDARKRRGEWWDAKAEIT